MLGGDAGAWVAARFPVSEHERTVRDTSDRRRFKKEWQERRAASSAW